MWVTHPPEKGKRSRYGQTSTEYLLVIAVLVIAMVIVLEPFFLSGPFGQAMESLKENITTLVTTGKIE